MRQYCVTSVLGGHLGTGGRGGGGGGAHRLLHFQPLPSLPPPLLFCSKSQDGGQSQDWLSGKVLVTEGWGVSDPPNAGTETGSRQDHPRHGGTRFSFAELDEAQRSFFNPHVEIHCEQQLSATEPGHPSGHVEGRCGVRVRTK